MNENQLIEKYQMDKDPLIRDQLFQQKRKMLNAVTVVLTKELFSNFILDEDDFIAYSFLSFLKCLESFNTNQTKYTFDQALVVVNKCMIIRYASQQLKLGHRALNTYQSLEPKHEWYSSYSSEEEMNANVEKEIEIEKIKEYVKNESVWTQRFVELKLQGYSNRQIANIHHVNKKRVDNVLLRICYKYRKDYV